MLMVYVHRTKVMLTGLHVRSYNFTASKTFLSWRSSEICNLQRTLQSKTFTVETSYLHWNYCTCKLINVSLALHNNTSMPHYSSIKSNYPPWVSCSRESEEVVIAFKLRRKLWGALGMNYRLHRSSYILTYSKYKQMHAYNTYIDKVNTAHCSAFNYN